MATTTGPRSDRLGRATWLVLAAVAVIYGPMAIEYMWHFFGVHTPELWLKTYGAVVGHSEATGAGSIAAEQQQVYRHSRVVMLFHTVAGGLTILLAIAQFNKRLRTRHPVLHRRAGRVQVGIVLTSMLAAMTYLVRTGPDATYDGPAFYMQLWFLAGATLVSSVLAVASIRAKQVAMHQSLMAYNFALLLTAPLLRVEYMLLGVGQDTTQEVTNIQGGLILGFAALTGAIAASRYFDRRTALPTSVPALPGRRLDRAAWMLSAVSVMLIVVLYGGTVGGVDRLLPSLVVCFAVFLTGYAVTEARARRSGHVVAAYDWRVHKLALLAAPVLLLGYWGIYAVPFTSQQAFYAAGLTAPPTSLTIGFLFTVWTRRSTRARTSPRPARVAESAA